MVPRNASQRMRQRPMSMLVFLLGLVGSFVLWQVAHHNQAAQNARSIAYVSSLLPEWILVLGTVLAAVLAYAAYLIRAGQTRAESLEQELAVRQKAESELTKRNAALEAILDERTRSVNQYSEELSRSNAELQQFAFIASHDLKEPLRMVSSYVRLLQRHYRGKLDAQADEFIDFATDGTKRMNDLIDALLRYSRVGGAEVPQIEVDTEELLETVLRALQPLIQERRTHIHRGKLPIVVGDPTQLGQLLQNLVSNAVKFSDGEDPQVWIGAECDAGKWRFFVRDNGIGIDPKDADRIFIIFQRLQRSERYPGTGIGLAVCKKIVERHRGRIWVESKLGQGSLFQFTLGATPTP